MGTKDYRWKEPKKTKKRAKKTPSTITFTPSTIVEVIKKGKKTQSSSEE